MNERLKQLLGQAYDEAVPETWTTLSSEQLGRTYEKFAELIVREMCQVINADCELQYSEGVTTNLGGLNQARELIKQHFGVEE
jgi:hypothetical protein